MDKLIQEGAAELDQAATGATLADRKELAEASGISEHHPEHLYAKLMAVNLEHRHVGRAPSRSQVEDRVSQAKGLPRVVSYQD